VDMLYKAEKAGVRIRLICRSMFSVVTGDSNHPSNISALGIVDRYLEHSRIFRFANGGHPKIFLSSADFLPRNFDSRFEVICPIFDENLQNELNTYLELQWSDNQKARVLDRNLHNIYSKGRDGKRPMRSQSVIRRWLAQRLDRDLPDWDGTSLSAKGMMASLVGEAQSKSGSATQKAKAHASPAGKPKLKPKLKGKHKDKEKFKASSKAK
jgi:hypothetical protein